MPSNCPTPDPNCGDKPVGSPSIGSPCSPCFDSSPKDFMDLLNALRADVCALQTKFNNWHTLLGRTRNRLTQLENDFKNLPEDTDDVFVGCGALEGASEADAVIVCDGGAEKAFRATDQAEQIVFCDGKVRKVEKGLQFYPLSSGGQVLMNQVVGTANHSVTLSDYPEDACGPVWAVFSSRGTTAAGPSGAATSYFAAVDSQIILQVGLSNSTESAMFFARVNSPSITIDVVKTGVGATHIICYLIGYMY